MDAESRPEIRFSLSITSSFQLIEHFLEKAARRREKPAQISTLVILPRIVNCIILPYSHIFVYTAQI